MVVYDLLVSLSKESIDVLRFVEANLAAFNQQYIFFNIQRKKLDHDTPSHYAAAGKNFANC
ncbi:hypothetical protein ASFV_Kyiv_2016_131_00185 [African swine fever virus]|uniref:Uncharacterized protein n=1 Tax=African swine fever virus TaxID=10497 RepID=A0A5B8XAB3_ASF|nr:hypothetical protein ASFV_Kyiv_2016_131_00185 [African swine fever virus]